MGTYTGRKYKLKKHPGITAIIINKNKILLLKRRNIPIILNPGVWAFLSGSRKTKEPYLKTAYREIHEEVSLKKSQLKVLYKTKIMMKDEKKKVAWENRLYFFRSDTDKVKLDIENSAYRWGSLSDITNESNYTNVFINKAPIVNRIKVILNGKEPKGKDR